MTLNNSHPIVIIDDEPRKQIAFSMAQAKDIIVRTEQTDAQAQLVGIRQAALVKSLIYGFVVKTKDAYRDGRVLKMANTKNLLFFGGQANQIAIVKFVGIASQSPREDPRVFALNGMLFAFGNGQ
jgi:hypothetical protein